MSLHVEKDSNRFIGVNTEEGRLYRENTSRFLLMNISNSVLSSIIIYHLCGFFEFFTSIIFTDNYVYTFI